MAGEPADVSCTTTFVEVKPQLQVAQVNLGVKNLDEYQLEVHKAGVKVFNSNDSLLQNIKLSDVQLLPSTCHGMQWSGDDGLHFRVQLDGNSRLIGSAAQASGQTELSKVEEKLLHPFRATPFTCLCVRCGNPIIRNARFSRVLPLPSGNWQEMTDSWFCHRHDDEDPAACHQYDMMPLGAKPGDCLVTSDMFMVHRTMLQPVMIDQKRSGCVRCQRCRAEIGQTLDTGCGSNKGTSDNFKLTSVQIYQYSITFPSASESDRLPSWRECIEHWVVEFILSEGRAHSTCRILIEAVQDGSPPSPVILLWVMDSRLLIYSGRDKNGENQQIDLKPQPVLKVMYKECLQQQNKQRGIESRSDFAVHSVCLPKFLCLELINILVRNTASMPHAQRQAADYTVGYLRCRKH